MKNVKQGFTLIELLVVVLIIGILASIAIPQYFKVVEKARVAEAMSVISNIKSAQERYLARGGTYATNFTDLDISYAGMTATELPTKFFKATIALSAAKDGGPGYQLNVKRHILSGSVAARYGEYILGVTIPDVPSVMVVSCPGGGENCKELLN